MNPSGSPGGTWPANSRSGRIIALCAGLVYDVTFQHLYLSNEIRSEKEKGAPPSRSAFFQTELTYCTLMLELPDDAA
jgi:hypothetical protein